MLKPLSIERTVAATKIRITGYIGYDVMDKEVTDVLDALKPGTPIEVYINSGGGSVAVGNAIAQAIKSYEGQTTAYIVGVAASMATIVAMACDKIVMHSLAEWMVHLPITTVSGRSEEIGMSVETAKEFEDEFVRIYAARTGMSPDDMRKFLQSEQFISARKAKEMGFVDEVLELDMAAFYPANTQTPEIKAKTETPDTMTEKEMQDRIAELEKANSELKAEKEAREKAEKEAREATAKEIIASAEKCAPAVREAVAELAAMNPDKARKLIEADAAAKLQTSPLYERLAQKETDPLKCKAAMKEEWYMRLKAGTLHALKAEDPEYYAELNKVVNS